MVVVFSGGSGGDGGVCVCNRLEKVYQSSIVFEDLLL